MDEDKTVSVTEAVFDAVEEDIEEADGEPVEVDDELVISVEDIDI